MQQCDRMPIPAVPRASQPPHKQSWQPVTAKLQGTQVRWVFGGRGGAPGSVLPAPGCEIFEKKGKKKEFFFLKTQFFFSQKIILDFLILCIGSQIYAQFVQGLFLI